MFNLSFSFGQSHSALPPRKSGRDAVAKYFLGTSLAVTFVSGDEQKPMQSLPAAAHGLRCLVGSPRWTNVLSLPKRYAALRTRPWDRLRCSLRASRRRSQAAPPEVDHVLRRMSGACLSGTTTSQSSATGFDGMRFLWAILGVLRG